MNDMTIYNPSGEIIREHTPSQNCVRKFSLMQEDYIKLVFSEHEAIQFPVGCMVNDFVTTKEQVGTWNASTGVWDYAIQFDAYYMAWVNKILRYVIPGVDSARETSFTLTATIATHANVIKNCLDYLGIRYNGSPFRIDTTDTSLSLEARLVRYENLSVLGGIQAIADAYECEWWVEGNAICFGKLENKASQFTFEAGSNTSSIQFSQGKTEAPNRLYVYGSDRNLPSNYREVNGNDTIGGVVNKRLMLPEGTPYLQTDPDLPESQIVEKVVTIDSVYPRTQLTVTEEPETYTSDTENEDGETVTQTFYRLRYDESFIFSSAYILPNEELHIVFQSGLLNGMDFGLKFNPRGLNEKNTDGEWNMEAQMFEVVANEDYGRMLPDDILKPQKGDSFIIYGWDTTKLADLGLIEAAEKELLAEGHKALDEYAKDLTSCTCPMAWDYMKPLFEKGQQPKPGDVVTIIDTAHFGKGGRKSRIIGYEYPLDHPYTACTYTCGENVSVSRLNAIEAKIDGLAKSGTKVQMQNSLDFLSKRYSDRTPYDLTIGGATWHEGWTYFGPFQSGQLMGFGGGVDNRGNAEFESLRVRSFAEFAELITNRQTVIEGDFIVTEGDLIDRVVENSDGTYTLFLHAQWEGYVTAQIEHNILRGIFNNITGTGPTGEGTATVHNATYYTSWMRILTVNAALNSVDVILYPDEETPAGRNFPPCAMMKVARMGNTGPEDNPKYAQRQQCFVISSVDGRMSKYFRMTKPVIDPGNVALTLGTVPEWLTKLNIDIKEGDEALYVQKLIVSQLIRVDYQGRPVATIRYRGAYDPAAKYYAGDTLNPDSQDYEHSVVEYYGCQWLCSKTGTANPPSWNSPDWTFYLGDPSFRAEIKGGQPINPQMFKLVLTIEATKMNQDVTDCILDRDVVWTRYSEDSNGVERAASDLIWATKRGGSGKTLTLTEADLDKESGVPPVCRFIANITLRDGQEPETAEFRL